MYFYCMSVAQKIELKIKRTAASRRSFNHPMCGVTRNLVTISKEKRYQIAISEGVFIPLHAVACYNHIEIDSWKNVKELIVPEYSQFTKNYIEDMFELLTNPSVKSGASKESSM